MVNCRIEKKLYLTTRFLTKNKLPLIAGYIIIITIRNKMNDTLKNISEFLKSEEGRKSMEEFFLEEEKKIKVETLQLERLRSKIKSDEDFDSILGKIKEKYKSKEYYLRHMNKSIIPPETLYFFLFEYAAKYGEKCSMTEYREYAGPFSDEIFKIHGYFFELSSGQGSLVHIFKPTN